MTSSRSDIPLSPLELIILSRLSTPNPPKHGDLEKVIRDLVPPTDGAQPVQVATSTLAQLRRRGLVHEPTKQAPNRLILTDAGLRALRTSFALDKAPLWSDIHKTHLLARVLGLEPGSPEAASGTKDIHAIAKTVVKNHHETTSISEIADALIVKKLGLPAGPVTLARMRAHLLAVEFGIDDDLELKKIVIQLAGKALGKPCPDKKTISQALIRRWAYKTNDSQVVVTPLAGHTDLLSVVREAIPRVGADGRLGTEKIFVSALWRRIESDKRLPNLSFDRFKRWLVTANRDQLLSLARADLRGADPVLVAESEIEDLGATFHLVVDPRTNGARGVHAR